MIGSLAFPMMLKHRGDTGRQPGSPEESPQSLNTAFERHRIILLTPLGDVKLINPVARCTNDQQVREEGGHDGHERQNKAPDHDQKYETARSQCRATD